jgi:chromosomal replication initiation ATPase DnaA
MSLPCLFMRRLGIHEVPEPRSMGEVAHAVARKYGLKACDLRGDSLAHTVRLARQEAMALSYLLLRKSNRQVAEYFGRGDHTSCINARHAYAERMAKAEAA